MADWWNVKVEAAGDGWLGWAGSLGEVRNAIEAEGGAYMWTWSASDAEVLVRAGDPEAATVIARERVEGALGGAPRSTAVRTSVVPAHARQIWMAEGCKGERPKAVPASPWVEPAPWHRAGVRRDGRRVLLVVCTNDDPFDHVEVSEDARSVTITVQIQRAAVAHAVLRVRGVKVNLRRPLAGRALIDGATSDLPDRFERQMRETALRIPFSQVPVEPVPVRYL